MRSRSVVMLIAVVLTLGIQAVPALGQRSRGPGFMTSDPNSVFERYSQGRGFFLISETKSLREPLMEWAQKNGLKDDKITQQQFIAAWPIVSESMKSRFQGAFRGGLPPMPGAPPGTPAGSSPGGTASPGTPDAWKEWAETDFKRHDANNDDRLNSDEMGPTLRSELSRWDTNKDGLIDLQEYIPYFKARMERDMANAQRLSPAAVMLEEDLDRRPVVFRAGKLPKELPPWFQELDVDNDGQVSLYEWRKARQPLNKFKELDRNDDGFLTAEEVLRHEALASANANTSPGQQVVTIGGQQPPRGPGGGGWGGGGGKGFGGSKRKKGPQ